MEKQRNNMKSYAEIRSKFVKRIRKNRLFRPVACRIIISPGSIVRNMQNRAKPHTRKGKLCFSWDWEENLQGEEVGTNIDCDVAAVFFRGRADAADAKAMIIGVLLGRLRNTVD